MGRMGDFSTLKPGKYGQAISVPSVKKLNPAVGIGRKGGPREYTHIHMKCTRGHLMEGRRRKRYVARPSVESPINRDAVYLNEK
jgi:hypothetical protein